MALSRGYHCMSYGGWASLMVITLTSAKGEISRINGHVSERVRTHGPWLTRLP